MVAGSAVPDNGSRGRTWRALCGVLAGALLLVGGSVMSAGPAGAVGPGAVRATSVRVFVPSTFSADQVVTGSCWVASIASTRADAYRCMVGNAIHDPCFSFGGGTAVECPTVPDKGRAVYIALTKPLPTGNALPKDGASPRPWAGTLTDGAQCGVLTGTDMFQRPFSCGLPGKNSAVTSVYCTWPAASRTEPSVYTVQCATGSVTSSGPKLGKDKTYTVADMWL